MQSGHKENVQIATDVVVSKFYDRDSNKYDLDFKNKGGSGFDASKMLTADELTNVYNKLIAAYPFVSIENPYGQYDWSAYTTCMTEIC